MSEYPRFTVTIEVVVHDKRELFRAAAKRACADGIALKDWLETRRNSSDKAAADLQMLLDPGASPAGYDIEFSHAERSADFPNL